MRSKLHPTIAVLSSLAALACPAPTRRIHLAERSLLSVPDEFAARRGIRLLPADREVLAYEIASESFELYLPASHGRRREKIGMVWVSPSGSGAPPRSWAPALDRLGVVWIGANASGNRRSPPDRVNLALDAARTFRLSWEPRGPGSSSEGFPEVRASLPKWLFSTPTSSREGSSLAQSTISASFDRRILLGQPGNPRSRLPPRPFST